MLQDFSAYSTGQELTLPATFRFRRRRRPPAPGGRYLGRARRGRAVSLYAQNVGGYATATDLFYEVFYPQNTSPAVAGGRDGVYPPAPRESPATGTACFISISIP